MHSMDDVFERMRDFERVLERFQRALESSMAEMGKRHADVDPLWQDHFRRTYDAHYSPLQAMIAHYSRAQGPEYLRFLEEKARALEAFLYGKNR